jgi:hypothetical protein
MEKPKKAKKVVQKSKTGSDVSADSTASQTYISHRPTEYRITIPSLEAWGYGERARVELRQDTDPVGNIVFYKEGQSIPDDDVTETGDIHMHLPFNMYDSVVDILRYEKPIKFDYNVPEKMAFFGTDWEPVGEGE